MWSFWARIMKNGIEFHHKNNGICFKIEMTSELAIWRQFPCTYPFLLIRTLADPVCIVARDEIIQNKRNGWFYAYITLIESIVYHTTSPSKNAVTCSSHSRTLKLGVQPKNNQIKQIPERRFISKLFIKEKSHHPPSPEYYYICFDTSRHSNFQITKQFVQQKLPSPYLRIRLNLYFQLTRS